LKNLSDPESTSILQSAPSHTEYPCFTLIEQDYILLDGNTDFKSSNFSIKAEHWLKLGIPGVSITLNPILNYSTVTISRVVPGAALSVNILNFSLYTFS
jgi:hypothetical protein